jgi:hypothetical protein
MGSGWLVERQGMLLKQLQNGRRKGLDRDREYCKTIDVGRIGFDGRIRMSTLDRRVIVGMMREG